jgi:hypothetical protein
MILLAIARVCSSPLFAALGNIKSISFAIPGEVRAKMIGMSKIIILFTAYTSLWDFHLFSWWA